ncbi:four helix bundle protein [Candidatus Wolfebacteria bacterium]|nr:four helix bundle protein [Candidatus Wolfebacteria bacterium]
MENQKIKDFTDLIAWQESHRLVLAIYNSTSSFPNEEIYSLTSQLRRAGVSVTSNIAEGFSRYSIKEKIQFYYMALGSVTELESQLILANDLKYLDQKNFQDTVILIIRVSKLINGLIRSLKSA